MNISNEKLIEIVDTLNYSRSLLADKEPNEIIDDLDDVIRYLDGLIIDEEGLFD